MRHIKVVPYDSCWPVLFAQEAVLIKRALGTNCIDIHHIGSTSVPGLAAKPVIDIVPVVKDIGKVNDAIQAMQLLGYETKGEYGILFRHYFQKGDDFRTHNIHVFEAGNPEIKRHLNFRDWMKEHKADRDAYASLKQELAQKYPHDIQAYCLGKEAFIANIDKQAGFCGIRIVKALTPREWRAVHVARQAYFSSLDEYAWTFDHDDHNHLVLYKGTHIVGYAHLQLCGKEKGILGFLFINESFRKSGLGTQLLNLCERWLKLQKIIFLQVDAIKETDDFFEKNKFIKMPVEDKDDNEEKKAVSYVRLIKSL